jgi:hypothetical protein
MQIKEVYYFSNQWLWILISENGSDYFYRFDQIRKLNTIEKRMRERETKTIKNLRQLKVKIIKNTCNGFYLAQILKEKKWTQFVPYQPYYLDPTMTKHIVSH